MSNDIDAFVNTSTDSATGVVMVDKPEADYVVGNYLAYYGLYGKYLYDTLTGDDSVQIATLAGLCPNADGMVVYQARYLYSLFGGSVNVSDDDCAGSDAKHSNTSPNYSNTSFGDLNGQSYRLYPNPNNGNINIVQKQGDDREVRAEILSATGQNLYTGTLHFNQQNTKVHIQNINSGLYMLQLTDADGKVFNLKFVVQ